MIRYPKPCFIYLRGTVSEFVCYPVPKVDLGLSQPIATHERPSKVGVIMCPEGLAWV